ncbi:hypothetical protein ABGN05_19795 [Aquibium sp. LZ166]|uniref:LPXTG cell wall anchor domain-containing protein n=1 Tax=Aquibium pacificus TaxID=3153579 RepID=A0ABV3SMB0_9HYPH
MMLLARRHVFRRGRDRDLLGPTTIGLLSDLSGGFSSWLWALSAIGVVLLALAGLLARIGRRERSLTR